MVERLKQIPAQLLELWNKYTRKQKTLIVSVASAVVMVVVILAYVLTRPQMEVLISCETAADASKIVEILQSENIGYELSDDSTEVSVDKKNRSDALLLLGSEGVPSLGMTYTELLDNSFATTESEKALKTNLFYQDRLRTDLMSMTGIDEATVYITSPKNDYTILTEAEEASVSVILTINDQFETAMAEAIANFVAGAVGNVTTEKVRITDQQGNLLFNGTSSDELGGTVNSTMEYKEKYTMTKKNQLYELLVKLPICDDAEIMPNFSFNMDKVTDLYKRYTPMEGSDEAVSSHYYTYDSTGTSGGGGIPGTDSNDESSYMVTDGANSNNTVSILDDTRQPNEQTTNTEFEVGAYNPEKSSVGINMTSYTTYRQEDLELQGLLADTTFEEYVLANQSPVAVTVTEDVYTMVSMATGIARENIQILAWEIPVFQAKAKTGATLSNLMMIVLAVLIIALLVFVVFKGVAPVEISEIEPELSVEQLLATTKENQSLDDIEFSDKSETRKMIEKFVDENPEAVAQLLRNWLNDEWGGY